MGIMDWLRAALAGSARAEAAMPLMLAKGRGFTFEIVGESHYQNAIAKVAGPKSSAGCKVETTAQLVFNDGNAHDLNAIGVLLDGRVAGFVPRDQAAAMRAAILRINPDERPVICRAKIVGGWLSDDGDEGAYGVKLSLAQPLKTQT